MESTGVYWIPLWQVLADDKFEVGLFAMLAPWLLSGVYGSFSMETEGRKEEGADMVNGWGLAAGLASLASAWLST
jgi:hypothetical protein